MNDATMRLPAGDGELALTVDEPLGPCAGDVVLVPPFGMSAERMFPAAYLLTLNGFRVLRFDPRDHPGESTGNIETFRLSRLAEDTRVVLGEAGGALVVAISLSARGVVRALVDRDDVRAAVLLTPVVSVRYTLHQVFGYDLFERLYDGQGLPPLVRVLGYDVQTEFVRDCMEAGMEDVRDALSDLHRVRAPVTFVAGDADPWVHIGDVQAVAGAAARGQVNTRVVQAASHQLYRNPVLAMMYLQEAARECLRAVGGDPASVRVPPFAELVSALEERVESAAVSN
jgi:pimeloyl-ACP methyl ester carboxylesterase